MSGAGNGKLEWPNGEVGYVRPGRVARIHEKVEPEGSAFL